MNPIGLMLIVTAAALALATTADVRATRHVMRRSASGFRARPRQQFTTTVSWAMASAWCLVIGLWLVVTR